MFPWFHHHNSPYQSPDPATTGVDKGGSAKPVIPSWPVLPPDDPQRNTPCVGTPGQGVTVKTVTLEQAAFLNTDPDGFVTVAPTRVTTPELTSYQRARVAKQIGPFIVDALVGVSDTDRQAQIRQLFGGAYSGVYDPNALKREDAITYRQIDMWDWANNKPGETLLQSIEFIRYNSWDGSGQRLVDGIDTHAQAVNPGEQYYRAPPNTPGYAGPYTSL